MASVTSLLTLDRQRAVPSPRVAGAAVAARASRQTSPRTNVGDLPVVPGRVVQEQPLLKQVIDMPAQQLIVRAPGTRTAQACN